MKLQEALKQLEALGGEQMRAQNVNHGAKGKQFGVKRGDVRAVAKKIKTDHALAMELWKTKNLDAQFLATLVMVPKELSAKEMDRIVRFVSFTEVADWFISYVVKKHPEKEALREKWMSEAHPMAARAGWSLTAERIEKDPKGLDLVALLDRIESEMGDADAVAQWTMNFALAAIGIHHAKLRKRALAIGEKLGVYRDFPVSKGCTSPFAPIWIGEMVKRQS